MSQSRLEHWEKQNRRTGILVVGGSDEVIASLRSRTPHADEREEAAAVGIMEQVWASTRELVFSFKDDKPTFSFIVTTLDSRTFELVCLPMVDSVDITNEEISYVLAKAHCEDIPVVPNNPDCAPALARHQQSGEMSVLREQLNAELSKHEEAARIVSTLTAAVEDLGQILESSTTGNESSLQECLTKYPMLFGLEYRKVIPQHPLGSDYVMDYALEKFTGIYDLAEIESSGHQLFTKSGDPRKELVHAEQQVLDWLRWVERNSAYARESLPGIQRPVGYVIIGRRVEQHQERLKWRNSFFRGDLRILTYDDVLDGARTFLHVLRGTADGI